VVEATPEASSHEVAGVTVRAVHIDGSRVRLRRSAEHRWVAQVDASALERGSIGCALFVGSHRGRPEFPAYSDSDRWPFRMTRTALFAVGSTQLVTQPAFPTGKQEKKSPETLGQMVGVAGIVASLLPIHGLFVPKFRHKRYRAVVSPFQRCLAVPNSKYRSTGCCTSCCTGSHSDSRLIQPASRDLLPRRS
jgi:hypothetical protein